LGLRFSSKCNLNHNSSYHRHIAIAIMSSYAADLAAIFSAPYDDSDPGSPEDQGNKNDTTSAETAKTQATPKSSPTKKDEENPRTPLLTSTPYVRNPAKEDETIDGEQSGSNEDYKTTVQHQYESIPEGEVYADGWRVDEEEGESSSPRSSPRLSIAVNPLNAMANSIAEALKKRSPTGSSKSRKSVIASKNGSRIETCLKYTPLQFDDEEQLPICTGTNHENLNANNNNSSGNSNAGVTNDSLAANGGVTTYGTTANQGGLRGSGRSGGSFHEGGGIAFKSPFSVLVICLGILSVFAAILVLTTVAKKGKEPHHVGPRQRNHQSPIAQPHKTIQAKSRSQELHPREKPKTLKATHNLHPRQKEPSTEIQVNIAKPHETRFAAFWKHWMDEAPFETRLYWIKQAMMAMASSTNKDHLIKWRNELKQQRRQVDRQLDEISKRSEEMQLLGLETRPRHADGIPRVGVRVRNGIIRDNKISEIKGDKARNHEVRGSDPVSGGIAGVGERIGTGAGNGGEGSNGAGRVSSDTGGGEISNRTF